MQTLLLPAYGNHLLLKNGVCFHERIASISRKRATSNAYKYIDQLRCIYARQYEYLSGAFHCTFFKVIHGEILRGLGNG